MSGFFSKVKPEKKVKLKKFTYDLPILYFRDDFFMLIYTADLKKVRNVMPTDSLFPVTLPGGRAVVGIGAFNYIDTSISAYGEIPVAIPVVHKKKPAPLWPLLRESSYPGFGYLVMHLPVTSLRARDGGRGIWGYTKFTSDMHFTITPEYYECEHSEKGKHIMTIRVEKRGFVRRDERPMVTYSVKDGNLIKTTIPQKAVFAERLWPRGSFVKFGNHDVARSITALGLSNEPLMSRYSLLRSGILPSGKIVEKGVSPLEGYRGGEREGSLKITYK